MTTIKLVQYADQLQDLHFVLYEDNTHAYVRLADNDDHAEKLQRWLSQDNQVDEYVPLISGGVIPLASIMWFCASTPPEGYLLCDGSEISRTKYANLFRAIGETYGEGNGANTFNLPNLVGRFCRGWGPVSPLDANRGFGSYQQDDVKSHSHGLDDISHTHFYNDPGHEHELDDPGHTHPILDPGHQHSVTDPGHTHDNTSLSHMGYAGNFLPGFATPALAVTPPFSGQESGRFTLDTLPTGTFFDVLNASANLQLESAPSNVLDETAKTDLTVDVHGVNIPYTELTGGYETRPDNIALLPVIRY
jgi:hypothetical protein